MSEIWLQHLKKNNAICREQFQYFEQLGFTLTDSVEASGRNPRYDGFHFEWVGKTRIKVSYYEQEIDVVFHHRSISASYWYIWARIFNKEPRFSGAMFSGDNLEKAITTIADDIKNHFLPILNGDDDPWISIQENIKKDADEQEKILEEALIDVPKLIKPSFQEAFDRINNNGLEGLRKKFAAKYNILQTNNMGIIEVMYTFKKRPTPLQQHAMLSGNSGTVQIEILEGMYATVEELAKRVEEAARVLAAK